MHQPNQVPDANRVGHVKRVQSDQCKVQNEIRDVSDCESFRRSQRFLKTATVVESLFSPLCTRSPLRDTDPPHFLKKELMPTVTELLTQALRTGHSLDEPLQQFVLETKSRAAGLWRLREGHLEMIGFASVADMPREIHHGFIEVTGRVSLAQNQFGIVRAVNTNAPTLAQLDPRETGLTGSASWLVKFACATSLAVPLRDPTTHAIIGAIAVSTEDILHEQHPVWTTIVNLAATASQVLPLPQATTA